MDATTFGWLVLAFPLAGSIVIALGWRVLPGRSAGWIGTAAIALSFAASVGMLLNLLDLDPEARSLTDPLYTYASAGGLEIQLSILVDPLSVFVCLVVTGVSTFIHLYSISYLTADRGYAALLQLPQLLRLLDAAAGPRRRHDHPDRRLGLRRLCLLRADQLLVPARTRRSRRG